MAPKNQKPRLVKVGKHFIDPRDVSRISRVKCSDDDSDSGTKTLYVVQFKSNPNPEHTCWVEKADIGTLLEQFEIVE